MAFYNYIKQHTLLVTIMFLSNNSDQIINMLVELL